MSMLSSTSVLQDHCLDLMRKKRKAMWSDGSVSNAIPSTPAYDFVEYRNKILNITFGVMFFILIWWYFSIAIITVRNRIKSEMRPCFTSR